MTNVLAINPSMHTVATVEDKLQRMKQLSSEMDALEAEYNMLKKEVIDEHFIQNDTYMTAKGLVLATYKASERMQFNSSQFKKDHEDIYAMYSEKKLVYTFNLKK